MKCKNMLQLKTLKLYVKPNRKRSRNLKVWPQRANALTEKIEATGKISEHEVNKRISSKDSRT